MSTTYYGGSKVMPADVRPLGAKTFAELITRYVNVPHPVPCERAHYFAQPKKTLTPENGPKVIGQNDLKDGPYLLAVSMKSGETHRCDQNAASLTTVFLDIDDSDLARPFVESPEALAEHLWPFNFACWKTTSSTPEKPRIRIALDIEEVHFTTILEGQQILARLVFFIAFSCGIPKAWQGSPESLRLSQPAYRPTVFLDDPKDYSPVLCSRTTGRQLQLVDVPEIVNDEVTEGFSYRGHVSSNDDIAHIVAPVKGLTVEDIREPLFKIDADCSYITWTRALTGIIHQFRGEEEKEAFNLADEWCRSGSKYCEGDTLGKWKSFKPEAPGRTPVTIATLFHIASEEYGWKNTRLANKLAISFKDWLLTVEDAAELMDDGPGIIAAQPFKNTATEASMRAALKARLQVLGYKIPDVAILRDIKKARAVQKQVAAESDNLPGWLRPWCFVTTLDRFFNLSNGIELSPEAFNRTYMVELMPGNRDEEISKGGRPSIMPCDFALNMKGRVFPKADGVVYDPRWQGEEPFFEQDGKVYVNSYNKASLPALDEEKSEWAGKTIKHHLRKLIANKHYRRALLDWMAYVVQNPGRKIRWAPVLQGAQGCGKTFLLNIQGAAIGVTNIKLSNPGSTKSDFNDWAAGAQIVGIEEIRVKGTNKTEIMDKLKDVMTNDRVALNRKNRDVATIDNVTSFIAFTNYHDALHLTDDDRRYFVVKCRIQSKAQKEALAAEVIGGLPYFQYLALLLSEGGAVRHFLLNHKISPDFNPDGDAPDTIYRRQMIEESKGPLQLAIEDMVRSGQHPMIGKDLILFEDLANRTRALQKQWDRPTDFLYSLGFQPHQGSARFQVNGSRSQVWVHSEHYDEEFFGDPVAELKRRHELISDESI